MTDNKDPIVISCNIVEKGIRRLIESGRLKADVTFLSSKLHYDYSLLEKALKRTIEKTLDCGRKNIVVIYGDVCLGFKYEMKELVDAYGIVKVDFWEKKKVGLQGLQDVIEEAIGRLE